MKIYLLPAVFYKVMHWVKKADFEVSGFGTVEIIDDVAVVTDAFLLEQEGSAGETEMKADDITKMEYQLRNQRGEMRWWWHSHVDMGVFWSGTDKATMDQLGKQGWFFHTVFNRKSDFRSAFTAPTQTDSPFHVEPTVALTDDIPTHIYISGAECEKWDKLFDEKVKRKTYVHTYNKGYEPYDKKAFNDKWETNGYKDAAADKFEGWTFDRDKQIWVKDVEAAHAKKSKAQRRAERKQMKLIAGRSTTNTGAGPTMTRLEAEIEIEDLMFDGYQDGYIKNNYASEIDAYKIDLKKLRECVNFLKEESGTMHV